MYTYLLDMMQGDYLVNIQTSVLITTTYTYNILCHWKSGDEDNQIIVGSHLGKYRTKMHIDLTY